MEQGQPTTMDHNESGDHHEAKAAVKTTSYQELIDLKRQRSSITGSTNSSGASGQPKKRAGSYSSRKRRRVFVVPPPILTDSASHNSAHSTSHHSTAAEDWHDDQPDLPHFTQLLCALLLTTVLAVLSALDAKEQCLQHETYALLDLVDDDNFQDAYDTAVVNESDKCKRMFRHVLVPTGGITTLLGSIALLLIYLYSRRRLRRYRHSPSSSLRFTAELLILCVGILAVQTYNISAVMLKPRSFAESDNPYQSLAAVDRNGHVGDNANLYYLSWISEGIALALVYQLATATFRLVRTASREEEAVAGGGGGGGGGTGATKASQLLPATSWDTMLSDRNRESRATWYQSVYRLRVRTGVWVAALFVCLVIVASSHYVWNQVVWRYARYSPQRYTQVCQVVAVSGVPPQLCRRTVAAWVCGIIASCLCATAIAMHLAARHSAHQHLHQHEVMSWASPVWEKVFVQHRLPLHTELVLSILLSLLLGFNAVFCTGVQGPAATVGNLYYASWISFLLCVRICLGCVEEFYNIDDKEEAAEASRHGYEAPTPTPEKPEQDTASSCQDSAVTDQTMTDPQEKERVKRLRSYFFLGIFSAVCAASAYDAASNQEQQLSRTQRYMILSPCVVTALSAFLFALCLSKRCYLIASYWFFGGVLSVVSFGLWLADLVLTMHSEDSWAVNGIGEIEMANLYYFSWAGIITAGLQMMSYVKAFLGIKKVDYMSVVWVAICKVCFVILGAGLHVWHTIAGNCAFDEITYGAVTYCSRTVLAMIIALAGMLVGGLVVIGRMLVHLCPKCNCSRIQAHVEMIISMFLVLLFGAAVALITGIGGPGQSVGDLYYSTWLAFWVSLGIFVSCYHQLQEEEEGIEQTCQAKAPDNDNVPVIATDSVLV